MALRDEENKNNVNDLAEEAGQNAPLTPMGAAEIGAPSKSADMMGTPAQVKANIEMQKMAQKQREDVQAKEQEQEAARLEQTTLSQQQRYGQPSPTEQQKQAADIANVMRTLGPVQSRVQGLIQARLNSAQQMQASTIVDEEAIKNYMLKNNINVGEQDAVALVQAVKNATDQDTYDKALQNLYNLLHQGEDGKVAAVPKGFETAVSGFFKDAQGAIEATVEPVITKDGAKLSELNLSGIDVDLKAVAKALNISEDELNNFTLEDLNAAIDNVEAQELGRIEELQNMLRDPTLSNTMRQAIYDELRQLGAAGAIGAEQDIANLQMQIDEANVIELFGEEYTLEEALSDEGISDLIAKAVTDEKLLNAMKKDPKYQSLAQWIETNKQLVTSLLDEYEFQATSFVDVQKQYSDFRNIFGKDEQSQGIVKAIAGVFAEEALAADGKFKNSLTSAQYALLKNTVESSNLFKLVFDSEQKAVKKEYSIFMQDLKDDPDLLKQFLQTTEDKKGYLYSPQDIQNTISLKNAFESENDYFSLLYGGLDGYVSSDDYFGKGEKPGLSKVKEGEEGEGQLEILTKWNQLSTETKENAAALQGITKDIFKTPIVDSEALDAYIKEKKLKVDIKDVVPLVKALKDAKDEDAQTAAMQKLYDKLHPADKGAEENIPPEEFEKATAKFIKQLEGSENVPFLSVEELNQIDEKENSEGVFKDLTTWVQKKHSLNSMYRPGGNLKADLMVDNLLGNKNFDARDLKVVLDRLKANDPKKKALLAIFDKPDAKGKTDGKITQEELDSVDQAAYERMLRQLGITEDKDGIINSDGEHVFKDVKDILVGIGDKEYEGAKLSQVSDKQTRKGGINDEFDKQRNAVIKKYGYSSLEDIDNVEKEVNRSLTTAKENVANDEMRRLSGIASDGFSELLTEINSLNGLNVGGTNPLSFPQPEWDNLEKLSRGGGLTSKEKKLLADVTTNGLGKVERSGNKLSVTGAIARKKALEKAREIFANMEKYITKWLDAPTGSGNQTNKDAVQHTNKLFGIGPGGFRYAEKIEKYRSWAASYRRKIESALSAIPGSIEKTTNNFNSFVDDFSTVENNHNAYKGWVAALNTAGKSDSRQASWNGQTYNFDELLAYGNGQEVKRGDDILFEANEDRKWGA